MTRQSLKQPKENTFVHTPFTLDDLFMGKDDL